MHPTLRQAGPRQKSGAAMCVRKISAQCVLQFTPSLAAGCVLHRPSSRVIHRSELCLIFGFSSTPKFDCQSKFKKEIWLSRSAGAESRAGRETARPPRRQTPAEHIKTHPQKNHSFQSSATIVNDPSAGSPTETLLRLLLPLNDQVWSSFRYAGATREPLRAPVRRPH